MDDQPSLFSEEEMRKPLGEEGYGEFKKRGTGCRQCGLRTGCSQVVFGTGSINRPDLMLIGEAPGQNEDRSGIPFSGTSGVLLDRILGSVGFDRSQVYLATVVNCAPPGNRPPTSVEIKACSGWLSGQIRAVQPRILLTMGVTAANVILDLEEENLTKIRGRWHDWNGIPVMPTFHPAYLLRNPDDKAKVWGDLQDVLKKLGRNLPTTG